MTQVWKRLNDKIEEELVHTSELTEKRSSATEFYEQRSKKIHENMLPTALFDWWVVLTYCTALIQSSKLMDCFTRSSQSCPVKINLEARNDGDVRGGSDAKISTDSFPTSRVIDFGLNLSCRIYRDNEETCLRATVSLYCSRCLLKDQLRIFSTTVKHLR